MMDIKVCLQLSNIVYRRIYVARMHAPSQSDNHAAQTLNLIQHWAWTSWTGLIHQVHGGGGGYDSDFSDDEQGESSEKTLKR